MPSLLVTSSKFSAVNATVAMMSPVHGKIGLRALKPLVPLRHSRSRGGRHVSCGTISERGVGFRPPIVTISRESAPISEAGGDVRFGARSRDVAPPVGL